MDRWIIEGCYADLNIVLFKALSFWLLMMCQELGQSVEMHVWLSTPECNFSFHALRST